MRNIAAVEWMYPEETSKPNVDSHLSKLAYGHYAVMTGGYPALS